MLQFYLFWKTSFRDVKEPQATVLKETLHSYQKVDVTSKSKDIEDKVNVLTYR